MPKLARQAGMSERSLRRHFRAETGTSIGSYLGHTRIKAMQLLIDDRGRSVSEVSISVGFNNPSAFAWAFRAQPECLRSNSGVLRSANRKYQLSSPRANRSYPEGMKGLSLGF